MELRFLRDRRGVAALEFALGAGVLLTLTMGLAEIYFRLDADQRAAAAAVQTADLVTRAPSHDSASLNDIRAAARATLAPLPASEDRLHIEVAALCKRPEGGPPKVAWRDGGARGVINMNAADRLLQAGENVIWTYVEYRFDPPLRFVLQDEPVYREAAFARRESRIALNNQAACP